MMNNTFKVPCEGVISIKADSIDRLADQTYGDLYIILDQVIYFRDCNAATGLVHTVGHIDITLNRDWYNKFVKWVTGKIDPLADIKILPRQFEPMEEKFNKLVKA